MVTVQLDSFLYRLHLIDMRNDTHFYKNVISKNVFTLRHYAKRMEKLNDWLLVDFYEVCILEDYLGLTKYYVVYKEHGLRGRRYYRPVYCFFNTFDKILEIKTTM